MKRLSLLWMLMLNIWSLTLFAQETEQVQVDQVDPDGGNYYYEQGFTKSDDYGLNDFVMYVALQNEAGTKFNSTVLKYDVEMAAYVDGVCRNIAEQRTKFIDCSTNDVVYLVRVMYAPTGSKVKLRLHFPARNDYEDNLEYEFEGEYTIEEGTTTLGEPSNPVLLTFVPLEQVSFKYDNEESFSFSVGLNETKEIPLSFIPENHTPIVNYKMQYDFANSSNYIYVDESAGTIKGLQQTEATYLGLNMVNTKTGWTMNNSVHTGEYDDSGNGIYTENTLSSRANVKVTLAVQSIEQTGELHMYPDMEANLADYYQINPETATNKNVTAVIPEDGAAIAEVRPADTYVGWIVKALAVGETYVTVTTEDGGKTVNIPIRVLQAVTGMEKPDNAPKGTVVVPVGTVLDSSILPYNILPEDASIKDVIYNIYNTGTTEAVSHSEEPETMGLPVAVAPGTAEIFIYSMENQVANLTYEVKVVEAITDMTLVAENQTIWTNNDVPVYTTYDDSDWFTFTPDVEHFPTITFTNEDGSQLTNREIYATYMTDAIMVNASTPGVYKMTITTNHGFNTSAGKEISKTITVTANQAVEGITGPNGEPSNANAPIEIEAVVGEDVTAKLAYVLTPENATNKLVYYVESGDTSVVHTYNDDVRKVIARRAGSVDIFIRPEGVDENSTHMNLWYRLTVVEPVTAINALINEMVIYVNSNQDYYINEGEAFEFEPATASQKEVEVTCSNDILYFDPMKNDDGSVSILMGANSYGETTVTITSLSNPDANCSFNVIVKALPESFTPATNELTVFLDEATDMPYWTPTALNPSNKQPVPVEYIEFNEENLNFIVTPVNQDYSWYEPIVFSDDKSQFAGLVPGSYTVQADYYGPDYNAVSDPDALKIRVRTPLNMQGGWNWVAFSDRFAKYAEEDGFGQYLNGMMDNMVEIRSEDYVGINDPEWGWFGQFDEGCFMNMYEGYKIRLEEGTYEPFAWGKDIDGNFNADFVDMGHTFSLHEGWNWIGFNNFRPVDLSNYLMENDFIANTRIIGQNGFAIYDGSGWTGGLQTLEPATGYLLFIPAGGNTIVNAQALNMMDPPVYEFGVEVNGPAATAKDREEIIWNYNMRQFANNMNIVAIADGDVAINPEKYSFGAFVGDECRGEGVFNKGYWFITLNGDGGEMVSFRLYNKETGEYTEVDNTLEFKMMAGTLSNPIALLTQTRPTGIDAAELAEEITILNNRIHFGAIVEGTVNVYDMSGRVVASQPVADGEFSINELPNGTYIVNVVADGAVVASKKFVK